MVDAKKHSPQCPQHQKLNCAFIMISLVPVVCSTYSSVVRLVDGYGDVVEYHFSLFVALCLPAIDLEPVAT